MDLDRKWTLAPATRPIPYCTEVTHIYKRTSAVDSQTISPGDVLYSFLKSMHLDLTGRQLRLKYFFLFCCTVLPFKNITSVLRGQIYSRSIDIYSIFQC